MTKEDSEYHRKRGAEIVAQIQAARRGPGLTEEDWAQVWKAFDEQADFLEVEFQDEMAEKHGERGWYHLSKEQSWELQKKLIQKLVDNITKESK